MPRADEDGRMLSLHNEFLLYIFKCKQNREIGHLLTKIYNFVQFNNKMHLFQCKVKYTEETTKIYDGQYFRLPCKFLQIWKQ